MRGWLLRRAPGLKVHGRPGTRREPVQVPGTDDGQRSRRLRSRAAGSRSPNRNEADRLQQTEEPAADQDAQAKADRLKAAKQEQAAALQAQQNAARLKALEQAVAFKQAQQGGTTESSPAADRGP